MHLNHAELKFKAIKRTVRTYAETMHAWSIDEAQRESFYRAGAAVWGSAVTLQLLFGPKNNRSRKQ